MAAGQGTSPSRGRSGSTRITFSSKFRTAGCALSAAGSKIDFKLTEECLLQVLLEQGGTSKPVQLATRDTPESLRRALEEEAARRALAAPREGAEQMEEGKGGLFSSLKRMLGRS